MAAKTYIGSHNEYKRAHPHWKKDYISVALNCDGSMAYVMTKQQYEDHIKAIESMGTERPVIEAVSEKDGGTLIMFTERASTKHSTGES